MYPVYDIDAAVLLGVALSAKRRPARLVEVMAAADMLQGFIPFETKLGDALFRLSIHGLVDAAEDGYVLTEVGQELAAEVPNKDDPADRIARMKDLLVDFRARATYAGIEMTSEQYRQALVEHQADKTNGGRNVLMPKPKADRHFKVEGKWRRVAAPKRGKTR